ncbi:hypothetical protein MBM_03316 [Drepanopeziza brunnea f. sp. 'multigermtubi' MB_m1]|uniref:MFS transporter n=1 Tax=Marssonina brunnea f. sp. multigermtubi (strain MB_m1) TaxID=1072389 RepID=K1XC35_MARBU|nr:uncharacterized protein MBM_03316 [Drepanopeziza brunnea f. sp. 'multigermtubi' MB_m1]EKD18323.1 hypothetical protein MBM_03316 [Drepanopeziza brunnea f. sp. 'multigermtubi' MB_m1]
MFRELKRRVSDMPEELKSRVSGVPDRRSALVPAALIMTLSSLGAILHSSAHVYLIEQAICRDYYASLENIGMGGGSLIDETICKIPNIQSKVASTCQAAKQHAALFLAGPYGKIGRVIGKKPVLILNMGSLGFSGIFFAAVLSTKMNCRKVSACGILSLTDVRSHVFYKLSASQMLISFVGLWLSSFLLRQNVWLQIFVGFVTLIIAIPVCFMFPNSGKASTQPETKSNFSSSEFQQSTETSSLISPAGTPLVPLAIEPEGGTVWIVLSGLTASTTHSLELFREMLYSSPLSRTTLLAFFSFRAGTSIDVILKQWPCITHGWVIAQVNAINAYEMSVASVILLTLPAISRRLLQPRFGGSVLDVDLYVTKICTLGHVFGVIWMGFAPGRVGYILAITLWNLSYGMTDALRSYVTGVIRNKEEVEQLYLGIGMAEMMAGIIASAAWAGVFAKVVGSGYLLTRLPFIGSAIVFVGCFTCVWALGRFDDRRKGNEQV